MSSFDKCLHRVHLDLAKASSKQHVLSWRCWTLRLLRLLRHLHLFTAFIFSPQWLPIWIAAIVPYLEAIYGQVSTTFKSTKHQKCLTVGLTSLEARQCSRQASLRKLETSCNCNVLFMLIFSSASNNFQTKGFLFCGFQIGVLSISLSFSSPNVFSFWGSLHDWWYSQSHEQKCSKSRSLTKVAQSVLWIFSWAKLSLDHVSRSLLRHIPRKQIRWIENLSLENTARCSTKCSTCSLPPSLKHSWSPKHFESVECSHKHPCPPHRSQKDLPMQQWVCFAPSSKNHTDLHDGSPRSATCTQSATS